MKNSAAALSLDEERDLAQLALGRLFRLGSSPEQPGDMEQYDECRAIIMDYAERAGIRR